MMRWAGDDLVGLVEADDGYGWPMPWFNPDGDDTALAAWYSWRSNILLTRRSVPVQ